MTQIDTQALESKVKDMYERVATDPFGDFHFEMGRALAERLGYDPKHLDRVPAASIDSFAGVGHHFALASLQPGEKVLDLGSGSGLDTFVAGIEVGTTGKVVGIDMTKGQLDKAESLRRDAGFSNVEYVQAHIDALPFEDESFDVVISNGVINLCADKEQAFAEIWRVLRPGGHLQFADIANGAPVPEEAIKNIDLWTA